jgi:hypothetical protein
MKGEELTKVVRMDHGWSLDNLQGLEILSVGFTGVCFSVLFASVAGGESYLRHLDSLISFSDNIWFI